ncbi:hypothetical protein P154DRAFT_547402 [Amniculicola lignicola CBS 123094]|uniref:Uncharacterized protein n=1 Tax=Amniculicola lignicola CBS 123094 TaxID=1392246 RepID=A0A6A5WI59_9PLEO|nr:hypothetical protein P154DRAFT_547402 [Amniculicola lignicola CBS 123094]
MYALLPAVVQSRIPVLPSLRKSLIDFRGRAMHSKSPSLDSNLSAPETPPPRYTSRPGSATPSQESVASEDTEDLDFGDDVSERPSSSRSLPPPFMPAESVTGINWRYANQGASLLTQACQESDHLAREPNEVSTALTRQLYIHGLTYLLRGIPSDLTAEEMLSLQAAVPQSLQNDANAHALIALPNQAGLARECPPPNPSVLHRVTAAIVFQSFILIQFLLPYIKLLIGHAYRFERDHKVTQRIFNKSIMTVDELGRRSLQLSQTVCQMNDGKVGQALNELTMWWVQGLTGGLQQGISEGFVAFGADRGPARKARVEKAD